MILVVIFFNSFCPCYTRVLCITYVDSCYKVELDAKAYQHFLKREEQRRRNEEEKKKLEEDLTLKETRNYANF